jgi:hypothetical protein
MLKLVFAFALSVLTTQLHPLHVSVTEIEFDEKDKALEIMMRVFIDDLEHTMKQRYSNNELDIINPKDKTLDEMMAEYLKAQFKLSLDGKPHQISYLGHEREGDAFIFYVEVPKVKKLKSISVYNSIITEVYEDQSNLVHVTVADNVKSLRLTKNNPQGMLSFN